MQRRRYAVGRAASSSAGANRGPPSEPPAAVVSSAGMSGRDGRWPPISSASDWLPAPGRAASAAGDAVLSAAVTRQLLDQVGRRLPAAVSRDAHELAGLTDREEEVLGMLAAGLSNAEIATAMVVSEATVKSHVSRILGKLGLRDRVQAVIYAYETGLITPRETGE